MTRILTSILAAALLVLSLAACSDDEEVTPAPTQSQPAASPTEAPPAKVAFMAGFKPRANLPFVGVYVAQEKGYFADENLEVEIRHVTTPGDNFKFLATNEIQFTTADASALLEKRAGEPSLPFVSIALIGQTGQQGFAVLANSGIETPADWVGKTAGYKGSQVTPDYLAILANADVERSAVEEVKVGFEPQILTEGKVDVFPVFVSNEPDTLRRLGFETTVFEAADYGAPTLGLTYITTEEYASENAGVVQRFLRAALRGVQYAGQNRDEAIDIVLQFAPQEQREHQRFMLDTELEMASSELTLQDGIGAQTLEQWQRLHDYLVQYGALSGPLDDVEAVFTDVALKEIYKEGPSLAP